ncbi:alpha-1,2-fucosyltransferase [Paenibacillus koleovorans]|uniref:alpha-1,2-fucosyltransferase n=1 Tax=Paenibacillus koleovorans TaxID=121608 RepID=UPI0013E39240|nr:alpha-1,2-fucosyltransferase [Paenibacillus koleovorans]
MQTSPLDQTAEPEIVPADQNRRVVTIAGTGWKGRFANQLFQYAFVKVYAAIHRLRLETPPWIGQELFGHRDPPISVLLPTVYETEQRNLAELFREPVPRYVNVNFDGYFQFHTSRYSPYRHYFRALFRPVPEIRGTLRAGWAELRSRGDVVVGIHLRRGDYARYANRPGKEHLFMAPTQWYRDWLDTFWDRLNRPVLFVASDDLKEVIGDFRRYNPVTVWELDLMPAFKAAPFYPDFHLLSLCDKLAISNSTFSFAASLLNPMGVECVRPHMELGRLVPYDPWNSPPLLHNEKDYY